MQRITIFAFAMLALTAVAGCTPDPNPGPNPDEPKTATITLGDTGVFTYLTTNGAMSSGSFDIGDQLPEEAPVGVMLSISTGGILISTIGVSTTGITTNSLNANLLLLTSFSSNGTADPCNTPAQPYMFTVTIADNEVSAISPTSAVLDSASFGHIFGGEFSLCLAATTDVALNLTLEAMQLEFVMPGEVEVASCSDVLALPDVQAALTDLSTNGYVFSVPEGWSVPDVEGTYSLAQDTLYDPDGANVGDTTDGTVVLSDQTSNGITRTGFDGEISQFVQGDASSIGFCTVQRTNNSKCDQTIARLESLVVDPDTGVLSGTFLSVAIYRHKYTEDTCGGKGDFIYGTISLTPPDLSLVEVRGKVSLPSSFDPDLVILPQVEGNGTVTDYSDDNAIHFQTESPFAATEIPIPAELASTNGFSALGISSNGERLAIVTDSPDALVTYDNSDLTLIRATSATTFDYLGLRVDFDKLNTRVYLPSYHYNYANRVTLLRADDSVLSDELLRLNTPQGKVPVRAHLRPDGLQLAVLLEDGADEGEAGELTFLNLSANHFLTPPIDFVSDADGTVLASELIYSQDGSLVFVAGLGAVLAVETQSPYNITSIDVSDGNGDNPIALALSGDGEVLAVAVDDVNSTTDFALIDVETLSVITTRNLGLPERGAIDVAHFQHKRIAVVANYESFVVAIRTESPYTTSDPIYLTGTDSGHAIGLMESGASTIAVTDLDEPAVYILEVPED